MLWRHAGRLVQKQNLSSGLRPACISTIIYPNVNTRLESTSSSVASADPDEQLTLPDGRQLGFTSCGSVRGTPIFFFHGSPGSRLDANFFHKECLKFGCSIIGVDRPGYGLSSMPKSRYTLLDWPDDIRALSRYLGLDTRGFYTLGISGGGPYSIACAHQLSLQDGFKGAGVLCGVGPPEAGFKGSSWQRWAAYKFNAYLPARLLRSIINMTFVRPAHNSDPKALEAVYDDLLTHVYLPQDKAVLDNDPIAKQHDISSMREAFRQGSDGYVLDVKTILGPWPFNVKNVKGKVRIWHGDKDINAPVEMARFMAARLPNAEYKEYEGDSHVTICLQRAEDILADLLSMA